ncbi:hypothetical protein KR084_005162 [Drosophila pseudotakahashii]|nr:hypothetical protein KR084_005162 [Drosophila pseudotakahashii]
MASAAKRLRKETHSDLKGARDSDVQLLHTIDLKFSVLKESLAGKIRDGEARITGSLEEKFKLIAADCNKLSLRVTQLENEVREMGTLKQRIQELEVKLAKNCHAQRVEELEAKWVASCKAQAESEVACDMRWHGVPHVQGENVRALFNALCFSLQLTPPPKIRSIFRMRPRQSGHTIVDPIIIIKLEHVHDKAALLRAIGAYRREKKPQLSLKLIGLDSPAFIYINEQLTKPKHEIFKRAMHLKRQKRLTAVFSRRGDIYVKEGVGGEAICVQSLTELAQMEICTPDELVALVAASSGDLTENSFRA